MMPIEQLKLGVNVAPMPRSHIEGPMARMVQIARQRETTDVGVTVIL